MMVTTFKIVLGNRRKKHEKAAKIDNVLQTKLT